MLDGRSNGEKKGAVWVGAAAGLAPLRCRSLLGPDARQPCPRAGRGARGAPTVPLPKGSRKEQTIQPRPCSRVVAGLLVLLGCHPRAIRMHLGSHPRGLFATCPCRGLLAACPGTGVLGSPPSHRHTNALAGGRSRSRGRRQHPCSRGAGEPLGSHPPGPWVPVPSGGAGRPLPGARPGPLWEPPLQNFPAVVPSIQSVGGRRAVGRVGGRNGPIGLMARLWERNCCRYSCQGT